MKLIQNFLSLLSFLSFLFIVTNFLSCTPETIIEKEFITVNDTITVSTIDTLFIPDESKVTTFILVRHAEKSTVGNDPVLTQEGAARAEKLANVLSEIGIARVYSTDFNRTTQTAMPTADNQDLTIINYGGFDHNEVIDDVLENVNDGKILIVGHSNTTANFLNALTGSSDYPDLSEDSYDNLFIVNTKSKGDSEVIHLKY